MLQSVHLLTKDVHRHIENPRQPVGQKENLSDRKKKLKCHHIFLIIIKNSFIFCFTANEITSRMLCLVSITNVKPFGFVNLAQPFIVIELMVYFVLQYHVHF